MLKISVVFCSVLALFSCAGNNKENSNQLSCSGNDWEEIGYETVMSGLHVRDFDKYKNQCGDHLEEGAVDKYIDGYTKGTIEFCTYDNGYELASSNKKMPKICPFEMAKYFEKGYLAGTVNREMMIQKLLRTTEATNSLGETEKVITPAE